MSKVIRDLSTLVGQKFHMLTIIGVDYKSKRQSVLICKCDCGKETLSRYSHLKDGSKKSCGCYNVKNLKDRAKHGQCNKTPEYKAWANLISRCENPNETDYINYGGRGITVCSRWRNSFIFFFEDMGVKPSRSHSLDRFPNVNGNYEKSNCRWATPKEQGRNKRNNAIVTINNDTKCISEWSEVSGIPVKVISSRRIKGWSDYDSIFAPIQKTRRKGLIVYNKT